MDGLWRVLAGSVSVPVGLVIGGLHRWAGGPAAILDIRVKRIPEVMDREERIHRLRRAALDPGVAGVLLRIEAPPGGYAACYDLRTAIAVIRRSGKPVYAYVESPGNAAMWIAAACDRVFCLPTGEIGLVGLGTEMTFFGAALERVGLKPDFEAAGAYKSFGETWTRTFPSAANQEAMGELMTDLHERIVEDVAAGRGLSTDEVRACMERSPMGAEEAREARLVDQLKYEDQLEKWLEEHHGSRSKRIQYSAWAARDAWIEQVEHWGEGGSVIAVLHFDGAIVMEASGGSAATVQARKVVPILRKLREDERVAAVVLHVNSPGGSAQAADLMWREIDAMREEKPVIACFEDVAASGGYYLAAPAAEIIARPTTLTGSIGVFGGKAVAGEGLRKLGVHVHELSLAPNATMFSPTKPFTDGQRVRFKAMIQRIYDGFVERVAKGRNAPVEEVEPHCRGRVWTGRHAHERKLVDRYGDVADAVDRARALAGLHHGGFVRVDLSADPKTWVQKQVQLAMKQLNPAAALVSALVPSGMRTVQLLLEHPAEPMALLPYDIEPPR